MTLISTLALFLLMVALALLPSTSVALVVMRAASAGVAQGLAVAAGIVAGDLVFVVLALAGMTALAEVMGSVFLLIRYLAAAYLIWLGVGLIRAAGRRPLVRPDNPPSSWLVSFTSGLLLTLGDVKAILFYASLFPVFIDLTRITATDIGLIIGVTIVAVGGVKTGYALLADKVAARLPQLKSNRLLPVSAGSFMVGAGCYLFLRD